MEGFQMPQTKKVKRETKDTINIGFKIDAEVVQEGVKLLKTMDASITNQQTQLRKEKDAVINHGNNLVKYLGKYGKIQNPDQIETIKNVLYDQLNWRRLGGDQGSNKGRIKGNPTITKYFSILKGYVQEVGQLKTTMEFSDIRTAYQDRGSRKIQRVAKYNFNRRIQPIFDQLANQKQANKIQKDLTALIESYCEQNNINLDT